MIFFLIILYIFLFYTCISIAPILKPIQENDCQSTWPLSTRQKMGAASRTDVKDVLQRGLGKMRPNVLLTIDYSEYKWKFFKFILVL